MTMPDLTSSEESGRAMALVIVAARPLLQRQSRLRPIQRLNLGLFIDAKHDGTVRRVEIEADNFGNLLLEHRGVPDLEALHDMRLQPGIGPDAPHARSRDTHCLSYRRAAPVRGRRRCLLHGLREHLQPDLPRKRQHTRGPRLVALEAWDSFIKRTFLPAPDRRLRHARPPHDLDRRRGVGSRKEDTRPPSEFAVGAKRFKLSAVGGAKVKADIGSSHPPFKPYLSGTGNPISGVEQ